MPNLPFPKNEAVGVKVLPVAQPIGNFFIGVAYAKDVVEICSANERKKDKLEDYIGIQRPLNPDRVEEIKKYVQTSDASFPNSIILAVNPDKYYIEGDMIYIKKSKNSANIIDGQHRLSGFDKDTENNFEVILTLFPELELEDQSYLFSVINTKMTRINASLAQDLYEFTTITTPEKLAHNIAKTLNKTKGSPWQNRIKMLGRSEGIKEAVLSQSTFSKEVVKLICDKRDSYTIRDILKRNHNKREALNKFYDYKKKKRFILWKSYLKQDDKHIYDVIKLFFLAVQEVYPNEWEDQTKILTKTTGYTGLMKVLDKILRHLEENNTSISKESFLEYIKKAKESGKIRDFVSDNYNPGGMGENGIYKNFMEGMELNVQ
ncbi:DGQHR domain-containing protein [Candidatus Pacearchaeota archaeon]|nr:DGQHR domain-containing protein [Candidatus Pacearchaeota archaeon]